MPKQYHVKHTYHVCSKGTEPGKTCTEEFDTYIPPGVSDEELLVESLRKVKAKGMGNGTIELKRVSGYAEGVDDINWIIYVSNGHIEGFKPPDKWTAPMSEEEKSEPH